MPRLLRMKKRIKSKYLTAPLNRIATKVLADALLYEGDPRRDGLVFAVYRFIDKYIDKDPDKISNKKLLREYLFHHMYRYIQENCPYHLKQVL